MQRRRDDDPRIEASWREHAQTALPAREDFAKQLDFHQIVGAMSSYPTVLRRLGLVVDFVLAREAFADSTDAPLSVAVRFADRAPMVPLDVSPVTHAALSSSGFDAVTDQVPETAALRVPGRLLEIDPKGFDLLQVDVDGAGLKVMNFARSLRRLARADERVDSVSRTEKKIGAPALRTGGLMLVQRQRAAMLKGMFDANAIKNTRAQAASDGAPARLRGAGRGDLGGVPVLSAYGISW